MVPSRVWMTVLIGFELARSKTSSFGSCAMPMLLARFDWELLAANERLSMLATLQSPKGGRGVIAPRCAASVVYRNASESQVASIDAHDFGIQFALSLRTVGLSRNCVDRLVGLNPAWLLGFQGNDMDFLITTGFFIKAAGCAVCVSWLACAFIVLREIWQADHAARARLAPCDVYPSRFAASRCHVRAVTGCQHNPRCGTPSDRSGKDTHPARIRSRARVFMLRRSV